MIHLLSISHMYRLLLFIYCYSLFSKRRYVWEKRTPIGDTPGIKFNLLGKGKVFLVHYFCYHLITFSFFFCLSHPSIQTLANTICPPCWWRHYQLISTHWIFSSSQDSRLPGPNKLLMGLGHLPRSHFPIIIIYWALVSHCPIRYSLLFIHLLVP